MLEYDIEFIFIFFIILLIILTFKKLTSNKTIIKKRANINLKTYKLIYTDQKSYSKDNSILYSKLLTSEKYGLVGKPDFIYKRKFFKDLLPVELKSSYIEDASLPREGDLMQLLVYFIIIEEYYGIKPKKGLLIYNDYMFKVANTKKYRKKLLSILNEMKSMLNTEVGFCDPGFIKCKYCICRGTVCEEYRRISNDSR